MKNESQSICEACFNSFSESTKVEFFSKVETFSFPDQFLDFQPSSIVAGDLTSQRAIVAIVMHLIEQLGPATFVLPRQYGLITVSG
jgi:hypothetical protein